MTVFKTFLKVLNKYKPIILMYTIILVFFGAFNMKTNDNQVSFTNTLPRVLIVNNDLNEGISKGLIEYITANSELVDIKNDEKAIDDAIFFRDVSYVIYIPQNFNNDFVEGKKPDILVKSTKDYNASLAEMLVERYLKVANIYVNIYSGEELNLKIRSTLDDQVELLMTSKLDTDSLSKATFYYNFTNYSLLAGCVYVICLILSSFKDKKISKRTNISSIKLKKFNRTLLLSNSLFALTLWLIYVLLSFILVGNIMFTAHGLFYILNSFLFTLCALTIAFLIGNIINNKEAMNGIINIIALGSSFLCGAFVPVEFLPDFVLKIAHILPSYWYINTNELLKTIDVFSFETLKPILFNSLIIIAFCIVFIILTNIISKKKRIVD